MAGDVHTFEPIFVSPEREYFDDGRWWIGPSGYAVLPLEDLLVEAEEIVGTFPPRGIIKARFIPLHSQIRTQPPVVAFERLIPEYEGWGAVAERFDFFGALRTGVHKTDAIPAVIAFLGETSVHLGPPPDNRSEFEEWCRGLGAPEGMSSAIAGALTAWQDVSYVVVSLVMHRPRPVSGAPESHANVDSVTALVSKDGATASLLTMAPLDREALRRFSGVRAQLPRTLLVGAGALGSKLGTHLVRTTGVEMDVVDPDVLLEHNLARHDLRRVHVGLPKAASLIDELDRMLDGFSGRAHSLALQDAVWESEIFPGDYGLTIDMTALPRMADVLASHEELPRVFSGFTILGGRYGIATLEGPDRNPRCDDLNAALYALVPNSAVIEEWVSSSEDIERVGMGGCADVTAVVADDDISIHAARMARIVRNDLDQERTGAIWILDVEGQIIRYDLGDTQVHHQDGWSIRVTSAVRVAVLEALEVNKPNEVAGYLHGLRDVYRKHLVVVHASVEPLIVQSAAAVEIDTSKYQDRFHGTLEFLGSWHTHPAGGISPSTTDEETAARIVDLPGLAQPLVFVIAEPQGLAIHLRG